MQDYPRPLTEEFVKRRNLAPGKYSDRDGLYLRVRKSGRKYWEHRFKVDGKLRTMGVGPYPVVSLDDARHKIRCNLVQVHEGKNPFPERRSAPVPTVDQLAATIVEQLSSGRRRPNTSKQWWSLFKRYVSPTIGRLVVCDVERRDLLRVLFPIWSEKRATAVKVRGFLNALFDHAVGAGYLDTSLMDKALADVLPRGRKKKTHFPAAPPAKVVAVLHAVERSNALTATKLSLRFQVLTAARLGEVRNARWSNTNREQRVWTVPADGMKAGEAHEVALSSQALDILDEAWLLGGANDLVFPSPTGSMLSNATHSKLVRELGFKWVPHGFRSSYRDWCAMNSVPREVAEAGLAHIVGNPVELAYARSRLLERRRPVMQAWADFLDESACALADVGENPEGSS